MILDHLQRLEALDTRRSFIVQAPAGSGKTELLIQRHLALLGTVDEHPESIVAITFTKKAAHEMRTRILEALDYACKNPEPESEHRKKTYRLAKVVLARSEEKKWGLLQNPNRLSIQTFDSFCSRLTQQLPLLSGLGGSLNILENAKDYYQKAAQQVWLDYHQDNNWAPAIKNLLWHMDNQLPRLQGLLAELLSRREQWLDFVGTVHQSDELATILQKHLTHLIVDTLLKTAEIFPWHLKQTLLNLMSYAAGNYAITGISLPLPSDLPKEIQKEELIELENKFSTDIQKDTKNILEAVRADLSAWKSIAGFLLTNEGQLRKTVDKRLGFPSKAEAKTAEEKKWFEQKKNDMKVFLLELQAYPKWIEALQHIQQLPEAEYSVKQQQVVVDLLKVLTLAVAELMVLFQQHGVCDFNQLLLGALQALGTPENPTDLALVLDYRIQHILVDEFQDTSVAQFRLLERLTAGWSSEDGRTLFLVGDPMQSIYRFRQAEVGLFLAAWEHGLGQVHLQRLTLQVNFRSSAAVVEWINQQMSVAFPAFPDIGVGAVPYTPATAFHDRPAKVNIEFLLTEQAEAQRVLELVQAALPDLGQQKIAILTRTRNQLAHILSLLQAENIPYEAVEIESLSERAVLQDLLILTRALLHIGDRVAWLALLRAPWCRLTLKEITYIVGERFEVPILEQLASIQDWSLFSENAQRILPNMIQLFQQCVRERQRMPISRLVLSTWLALGGPSLYEDATVIPDAELFFTLLETLEAEIYHLSPRELEEKMQSLFATPNFTQSRVQVMTMHKAKGLEFDTVIIPGLHASSRVDTKNLLEWWERPREKGSAEILIAPLHAIGEKEDSLYNYLWLQRQRATELEVTRLLYVAFTRAKNYLHLIGVVEVNEEGELRDPSSNSLLAKIWDSIRKTAVESSAAV